MDDAAERRTRRFSEGPEQRLEILETDGIGAPSVVGKARKREPGTHQMTVVSVSVEPSCEPLTDTARIREDEPCARRSAARGRAPIDPPHPIEPVPASRTVSTRAGDDIVGTDGAKLCR